MFEELAQYSKIIVTGPQRSGTRICAQMIAADTGHAYLDEGYLAEPLERYPDSIHKAKFFLTQGHIVVHAPALCARINELGAEDTLIVMMKRDVGQIIQSQQRINWNWEARELAAYGVKTGVISSVKYARWMAQKETIPNWREIEYESLRSHPLWVDEEQRKEFLAWQTKVSPS